MIIYKIWVILLKFAWIGRIRGHDSEKQKGYTMDQEYQNIDLKKLFVAIKRNIIKIVAVALVCAIFGFAATHFFITPQYEASATMIVNARASGAGINITNEMINTAKSLADTYGVIIKSDTVLEPVIEELGLNLTYGQLASQVTVSSVESTQIMKISIQDQDPARAKEIIAKIVEIAPDVLKDTVEAGSVKVVSEARVGGAPVSPNKKRNTVLAATLGVVASLGVIVLKEIFNNKFKSEEDIQKYLGYTVLGVIPYVEGES